MEYFTNLAILDIMAGIYIHIPFCRKACTYCNFHFSTSLGQKEELLKAIAWELVQQKEFLMDQAIESIYFGGGTPSLLEEDELMRIFDLIAEHYDLNALKECTLEANPDDLNKQYVRALKKMPINRLSIGIQSFFDSDLHYMNRAHNAQQAEYAIKNAQDIGFENLSIDLIYGTPGLSNNAWQENLGKTLALSIPHFSAYALTVEEGTTLHYAIHKKNQQAVDPEQSAQQFEILMDLTPMMGFEQYEISNFAAQGKYALHNTNYWKGIPYLGIGPSAHSFDGRNRKNNIAHNSLYIKSIIEEGKLNQETETLNDIQRVNEYIMTSLRTIWGCDLNYIKQTWGSSWAKHIREESAQFEEKKWLKIANSVIYLTNSGKLFADHISATLFIDES